MLFFTARSLKRATPSLRHLISSWRRRASPSWRSLACCALDLASAASALACCTSAHSLCTSSWKKTCSSPCRKLSLPPTPATDRSCSLMSSLCRASAPSSSAAFPALSRTTSCVAAASFFRRSPNLAMSFRVSWTSLTTSVISRARPPSASAASARCREFRRISSSISAWDCCASLAARAAAVSTSTCWGALAWKSCSRASVASFTVSLSLPVSSDSSSRCRS
mmetsp:Transcript_98583/g.279390  ORF Transcript_98583/g.279390 Transcript_98583/m.279390 type:complete len:223 (+) Transcript_98583:184-852(+)